MVNPTTDAKAALAGSMLAMGGTKGAMLALIVELLACALTGAAMGFEADSFFVDEGNRPRIGQAFLVIDPEALAGRSVYLERVETLVAEMAKDEGVRLPGARRRALAAKAVADGVEIPAALSSSCSGWRGLGPVNAMDPIALQGRKRSVHGAEAKAGWVAGERSYAAIVVFGSKPKGTGALGRHFLSLSSPRPIVLASSAVAIRAPSHNPFALALIAFTDPRSRTHRPGMPLTRPLHARPRCCSISRTRSITCSC